MILGLRTVIYPVADLAAARAWYARAFGIEPYFDQPFYVGFAVGAFELGLIPDGTAAIAGTQAYWGVADIEVEYARLRALGATELEPIRDVGGDIKTARLADPFGNALGIIQNPHFDPESIR
jgi:predicted enzyme related to lactoylglutathione lyase